MMRKVETSLLLDDRAKPLAPSPPGVADVTITNHALTITIDATTSVDRELLLEGHLMRERITASPKTAGMCVARRLSHDFVEVCWQNARSADGRVEGLLLPITLAAFIDFWRATEIAPATAGKLAELLTRAGGLAGVAPASQAWEHGVGRLMARWTLPDADDVERANTARAALLRYATAVPESMNGAHRRVLEREHRLFSVRTRRGRLYPSFQFDGGGRPLEIIHSILATFPVRTDPWEVGVWFVAANGWLGGRRPVDLLDEDPQGVLTARIHQAGSRGL